MNQYHLNISKNKKWPDYHLNTKIDSEKTQFIPYKTMTLKRHSYYWKNENKIKTKKSKLIPVTSDAVNRDFESKINLGYNCNHLKDEQTLFKQKQNIFNREKNNMIISKSRTLKFNKKWDTKKIISKKKLSLVEFDLNPFEVKEFFKKFIFENFQMFAKNFIKKQNWNQFKNNQNCFDSEFLNNQMIANFPSHKNNLFKKYKNEDSKSISCKTKKFRGPKKMLANQKKSHCSYHKKHSEERYFKNAYKESSMALPRHTKLKKRNFEDVQFQISFPKDKTELITNFQNRLSNMIKTMEIEQNIKIKVKSFLQKNIFEKDDYICDTNTFSFAYKNIINNTFIKFQKSNWKYLEQVKTNIHAFQSVNNAWPSYNKNNIFTLINLQVPINLQKFQLLKIKIKLRIFCIIFVKYVKREALVCAFENFIGQINLKNIKSIKRTIFR